MIAQIPGPSAPGTEFYRINYTQVIPAIKGPEVFFRETDGILRDVRICRSVAFKDAKGNSIQLYYNLRWKEPISNSWVYMSPSARMTQNSEGDRILVTFDFKDSSQKSGWGILDIPMGTETDFQVQAMIGYYSSNNVFTGKTSDWTDTHSVMHASLPTDFNSPTPTPSVPEFPATIALTFLALTALAIAVVSRRKHLAGR